MFRIRTKRSWMGLLVLQLLLAAGLLAACGSDGDDASTDDGGSTSSTAPDDAGPSDDADPLAPKPLAEKTTLVVTTPAKLLFVAPLTLADAFGEFEKENLEVDIQISQNALQVMATDASDVAASAPESAWLNAMNAGVAVRWVAGNYLPAAEATSGFWVRKDKVGDPVDLSKMEGLKIAASQGEGSVTSYFIDKLLEGTGIDVNSLEMVKMAPADSLVALENEAIDGAWLNDPLQRQIADNPDFVRVGGQPEETVGGGFFFGERLLDPANREIGEAFIRALARTIDTYLQPGYAQDDEVVAELARIGEIPEESISGAEELQFELRIQDGLIADMQATWLKQSGLEFDEPLPDDEVIDLSFVNAVLGES